MKSAIVALAMLALTAMTPAVKAGTAEDVTSLYSAFAAAQNDRDLMRVRMLLLDSPRFLWVSDGKSIWGRKAVLKRMALFQEARIWHVEPELEKSAVVPVGADAAYLHLPLELAIAFSTAEPETLRFLVSVLCVRTQEGWRIAALFTTTENPN